MPKTSRNLKIFLIILILSLPFWWKINVFQEDLENFLFWKGMADNSGLLAALISQESDLAKLKPIREWQVRELEIEARSALSVYIDKEGGKRILFEKNSEERLPIASLTKLMTADIILENYNLSQVIEISDDAVKEEEDFGNLKTGEIFIIGELLYPLLMESSNDAAAAFAQVIGENEFLSLMNLKARDLGLEDTHFINPTGLDPKNSNGVNYSTVKDLARLAEYLLKKEPLIWQISGLSEFNLYTADKVFHHKVENTNKLLGEIPSIIGGKTGDTRKAGQCLILVLETPRNRGYLINVILGSQDRFGEMKKLASWVKEAYKW